MARFVNDVKAAFNLTKGQYQNTKFKISDFKRLLPYMKSRWGKAALASLGVIILSLSALPIPYLMKIIYDDVFLSGNLKLLHTLLLILLGIQVLRVFISFFQNYFFTILGQEIILLLKKDLFVRLLKLPFSFFDKSQTGYLLSRINEVHGLSVIFSGSIIRVISGMLEFVFCLVILFYLHWPIAIFGLVVIPIYYYSVKYFSKGISGSTHQVLEKRAIVSKNIQESLAGISEIKAFATEKKEAGKIHKSLSNFLKTNVTQSIFFSISTEFIMLISVLGGYAVLWYCGFRIIRGELTIGDYIAFTGYLAKLFGPTQMLASLGLTLQPVAVSLDRVSNLFSLVTEEEDENRKLQVKTLKGKIEFKKVSFHYEGRKETLHDISLCIKPGETVGFVGPSGSGKSTLIRLILGFYVADKGDILIDGQNVNQCVLTDLRERFGIVSQNIFLFNDSIKNNIRYSKPDATEKEIVGAARIACAHDFITNLPESYHTQIGEKGVTLSGGQIQRIAITRAILKNPDILILDEATSHIDNATVQSISDDINKIFKGKTRIFITHRLESISFVDKIFIIEEGRLKRQGKFHEIYMENGRN